MKLDPADYACGEVLGHDIELLHLRPGDVIFCRPRSPLSESQSDKVYCQINNMAGENPDIRIVIVPSTWDLALARFSGDEAAIDGLRDMIRDFSS